LSQTLFPEISEISAKKDLQHVSELINTGLSYAGLFLIPGFVGGAIIGKRILRIYGSDFTQAWSVLTILIAAALIQTYQKQITNTLNAVDRPDLAFRVNIVFIISNVVLNIALIYFYGWIGAAIATAFSVAISLFLGYHYLSGIVQFELPIGEIINQLSASIIMAVVVISGLWIEIAYLNIGYNLIVTLFLVSIGAATYFIVLINISSQFRDTVNSNLSM
jgi:O-antigen/teichoic acid export membrane protein